MLTRRTLLATAVVVPASRFASAQAAPAKPTTTLPETVKAHGAPYPTFGSVTRLDPALDKLLPPDAKLEKLAEGFDWIEGPVWVKKGGYLLFSEIPLNSIYRWQESGPAKGVSLFLKPSGYHGDRTDLKEPGSNGLALGKKGELYMCQHGDRRLAKLASVTRPQGKHIVLADKHEGKRFNSPNDLVLHSSGDIFFTDPPYGLAKTMEDKEKEIPFQGIYRLDGKGKVHLLSDQMERPNGIGLSPDEKTLYVANSHQPRPIIMAFDVTPERGVKNGRIFFNGAELLSRQPDLKGSFDGMAVDKQGNLFATGPGGVLVITPAGKHLGTIMTGEATSNCKFGGADGKTLYITADQYLCRMATSTVGLVA
jgi:gluconolactonase